MKLVIILWTYLLCAPLHNGTRISPFAITAEQACGLLARGSKQPRQKQEEEGESKFPSCGKLRGGGYGLCYVSLGMYISALRLPLVMTY